MLYLLAIVIFHLILLSPNLIILTLLIWAVYTYILSAVLKYIF